jgi:hypothetical protein
MKWKDRRAKEEKVGQDEVWGGGGKGEILQLKGKGRCELGLGGGKQRVTTIPLYVCEGPLPLAAHCK